MIEKDELDIWWTISWEVERIKSVEPVKKALQ